MSLPLSPPPHVTAGRTRSSGGEAPFTRLLAANAGRGETPECVLQRLTVRIRAVARAHRLGAHDVEDVVQLTWLRLLEHAEAVREPAALPAWLHTTARHESLRVLRESARVQPVADETLGDREAGPGLDHRVERQERRSALIHAIAGLSGRQRALMLALLADPAPSYERFARTLAMPIGSIGPTRARCMERLRRDHRLAGVAGDDAH